MLPQKQAYVVARQSLKSGNPDSDNPTPAIDSDGPGTGQFVPGLTILSWPDFPRSPGKTGGSTTLRRQQVAQISRIIGNKATERLVQRVGRTRRGAIINSVNPYSDESESNSNNSNIVENNTNSSNESESNSNDSNIIEDTNSNNKPESNNSNIVEDNNDNIESESDIEVSEGISNSNTNSNVTGINKRKRRNAQLNYPIVIKNSPTKTSVEDVINPNKPLPMSFTSYLLHHNDKNQVKAVTFMRELAKRLNKLGTNQFLFSAYMAKGGVDELIQENFDKFPGLEERKYDLLLGKLNPEKDYQEGLKVKTDRNSIELTLEGVVAGAKSLITDLCVDFNVNHSLEEAKTEQDIFEEKGVGGTGFVDSNLTSKKPLGKGGMNTVFEMDYGDKGKKVWKEDQDADYFSDFHNGGLAGIPSKNPEYSKRAVAMYRLDQLIGADVIPETDFAIHEGKFGTVSDFAPGKAIMEFLEKKSNHDYALDDKGAVQFKKELAENKVFKNALAKLQLLDVLAGQVDRHLGNYHLDYDESTKEVKSFKGIDNDMAFGKGHQDIFKDVGKYQAVRGGQLMGNSEHVSKIKDIDRKFAQKIINLDPEKLKEVLKELLEESEVEATCKRLAQLQEYLQKEENKSKIVDYE